MVIRKENRKPNDYGPGRRPDKSWRIMFVKLDRDKYHKLLQLLKKQGVEVETMAKVYRTLDRR